MKTAKPLLFALLLALQFLIAVCAPMKRAFDNGTPRGSPPNDTPWSVYGNAYRPAFEGLDSAFKTNSALEVATTFSTLDFDVTTLLTTMYDKRAYNPDPCISTRPDKLIEYRLYQWGIIHRLSPAQFEQLCAQQWFDCFMLGHNKYKFATDWKYGDDSQYPAQALEAIKQFPQWGWFLVIPQNELAHLGYEYARTEPDPVGWPDCIVTTGIEEQMGLFVDGTAYRLFWTNDIFQVYLKKRP